MSRAANIRLAGRFYLTCDFYDLPARKREKCKQRDTRIFCDGGCNNLLKVPPRKMHRDPPSYQLKQYFYRRTNSSRFHTFTRGHAWRCKLDVIYETLEINRARLNKTLLLLSDDLFRQILGGKLCGTSNAYSAEQSQTVKRWRSSELAY